MKSIEIDDDLYFFLAGQTEHIGESASDILRRILFSKLTTTKELFICDYRAECDTDKSEIIDSFLQSPQYQDATKVVDKFLMILSLLYKIDTDNFILNINMKGRTRVYISDSKDILTKNGNTTKPRPISDSPYWVITNLNTERKKKILMILMNNMKFDNEKIQKVLLSI